ncbi:MAG: carboxypeptidase-like regulatory domain-containing protein, partial [Proteobacteria bacterium]|nr:carboxypeptidase-like regulatory domain-containing protein [Pseudomonadota bacterium]
VGPIPPLPPPGAEIARTAIVVDATGVGLAGEPPPLAVDPARGSLWKTGADGRYRIRGLTKGKVAVLALAPGLAEGRSKQVTVEGAQLVPDVDVILSAGTFLIGKVADQHGQVISGAQLAVRPESGVPVEGFTDLDGAYRLGPFVGKVELRAQAYGHGEARRTLELPLTRGVAEEHREDLVLAVADAMIVGTLDDATGAAVGGAHIEVVAGAPEGRHAIVADDGTFAIEMLPAGSMRLKISHPSYPPFEVEAIANDGKARARLRLPLGGAVEGVLLDANGATIAGIPITATAGTATSDATSDATGQWKLGPVAPGRWKLAVTVPGYLPLTRELDVPVARTPGATSVRDVRLDLARSAILGGTVRDGRGTRLASAHVSIRAGEIVVEGDTDGQGEFRIRDTPTGEVDLTASKGDLRGSTHVFVKGGDEILGLSIELR